MKTTEPVITFPITDAEIDEYPFFNRNGKNFYHLMQKKCYNGNEDGAQTIDCRLIDVAQNINDKWVEQMKTAGMDYSDIGMTLCIYAPKVDKTLPNNCVSIAESAMTPMPALFAGLH